jgi:hypothetical protein
MSIASNKYASGTRSKSIALLTGLEPAKPANKCACTKNRGDHDTRQGGVAAEDDRCPDSPTNNGQQSFLPLPAFQAFRSWSGRLGVGQTQSLNQGDVRQVDHGAHSGLCCELPES